MKTFLEFKDIGGATGYVRADWVLSIGHPNCPPCPKGTKAVIVLIPPGGAMSHEDGERVYYSSEPVETIAARLAAMESDNKPAQPIGFIRGQAAEGEVSQ